MEYVKDIAMPIFTALLGWWLSSASRNRADRAGARATLEAQADAFLVAVSGVRAAATVGRVLWDRPFEQFRTGLLAALTIVGGAAGARALGGSDRTIALAGLGSLAGFAGEERRSSRVAAAPLTGQMTAVVAAAAPLLRQPRTVADPTLKVLDALSDVENEEALDQAMTEFGDAVRQMLAPRRRWWHRGSVPPE
ncbi:hypothetical protein [Streptomyces sp. NPDC058548]|uniref:hypothetical protein n=1 Tax=Streptomyces sp. NPDC058548 TaxID=3346545 RepID=UPI00364A9A25